MSEQIIWQCGEVILSAAVEVRMKRAESLREQGSGHLQSFMIPCQQRGHFDLFGLGSIRPLILIAF